MDVIEQNSSSDIMSSSSSVFNIDLTGDIINNYNVIVELGHGSYSIVWLVYCIEDNKYYAMKVQNPEDYEEGNDEINILKQIPSNEIYINKLKNYFIETRFIDDIEYNFICSIFPLCCGNLDGLARKGNYNKGYPIPIVKKMLKQICMGLNTIHTKLNGFHGDIKPDNILLCGINDRDKKYIELYDMAQFPLLYKNIKKKYMTEKKMTKLTIKDKLRIRKELHMNIINSMPVIEESPYMFDKKYIDNLLIKITDFGFYCHKNEKFNESFGTCYYQAPEIILDGNCTEKIDIWALGCMLYELLTGEILFDADADERGNSNFNHIEMMINLCGEFSSDFLNKTKNKKKYFNNKNKLENIIYDKNNKNKDPIDILRNKLNDHDINDNILCDLLIQMLILDPNKRISINNILAHKWLK